MMGVEVGISVESGVSSLESPYESSHCPLSTNLTRQDGRARRRVEVGLRTWVKQAFYHWPMVIEELESRDQPAATALWKEVGMTRPWNDPASDFDRALQGATSTVLGVRLDDELVGTVMVGHDGHRGWAYYLAVAPVHQAQGLGSQLMSGAEDWLRARGSVKIQLMVRDSNEQVLAFYEHLGYEDAEVTVLSRWLTN